MSDTTITAVMKYIGSAVQLLSLGPRRASDWELVVEDLEKATALADEEVNRLWGKEEEEG